MADLVIDTQIAVWYFENSTRLSTAANTVLDSAVRSGGTIFISTITIVELIYLIEKGRLAPDKLIKLNAELRLPNTSFAAQPLTKEISDALGLIPRTLVADMPDRIISATALYLNLPLITSDSDIHKLTNIQTIW
ncbi:MAG: PIN domain-containing protein [Acidobacteria bacterium]|nr:PIN domain-containing protein [Acidobacteriota bacterium]